MKRHFYSSIILLILFPSFFFTQTISGKLVDQNGNGLNNLQLKLYISSKIYPSASLPDGSFTFNNVSSVIEGQLPDGYFVSNNFPNPFNPKTRIGITLLNSGSVRANVYNLLGQSVCDEIEKYFSAGESYIDLELNGLPNGFYLARITLNEKYSIIRKLMLIYGSQHLSSSIGVSNFRLNKSTLDLKIDSLVVTGSSIAKKVFTNLPNYSGSPLNLGNLVINLPPQAPTLMGPPDGAPNSIIPTLLIWYASSLATSYTLQVSTNNAFSSYIFNQSGLTSTSQQISGLSNSTTYYWRVNAANSYGTSDWCPIRSFTTMGSSVPPPQLISPPNGATNISSSITLIWGSSGDATTSYILQVSTNNLFSSFIFNQNVGNKFNQQISGLNYSTTYYWRVSATNSNGTSQPSLPWSFTTITPTQCAGVLPVTYNEKVYNTVQIGNQCWLSENLDVGTMIQGTQNQSNNGAIEKYCYNNDANNCSIYGGLYLWDEAMQYSTAAGTKGICPTGWHIPTQTEFQTLSIAVNGNGNSLKAAGQGIQNGAGTNTSGFSALLAGCRWFTGSFQELAGKATFLSSYDQQPYFAYALGLVGDNSSVTITEYGKNVGYSIRCIKN